MPRKNKKVKKRRLKRKVFSKRNKFLKLATKIHSGATILVLLLYISIGIFGGPEYVLKDVKDKYQALASATTLSLRVVGPPGKPSVTATPGCSGTSALVLLDWAATSDTDNYDVYRGGSLLASGITDDYYQDTNVQTETSYAYYVIANGPLGNTQSDDVPAATGKCLAAPTCQIATIENIPFIGIPEIESRTPTFSGTTNIANADMTIGIYSGPTIIAGTTANINGYWSWQTPSELDRKTHTIYVTATDPLDPARSVQISRQFTIREEEEEKEKEKKKKEEQAAVPVAPAPAPVPAPAPEVPPPPVPPSQPPVPVLLEFKISVTNPEKTVYSGRNLEFNFEVIRISSSEENIEVEYAILDSSGKSLKNWSEKISLPGKSQIFEKKAALSKLMKSGRYKIMAKAQSGLVTISAEDSFEVRERPIFNLGSGFIITYPVLLAYLGWLLFFLLFILLFFSILLALEHHLSKRAAFHIAEDYLEKKGVISKRKEVLK